MSKLTLADVADLRAYERERDMVLADVIALKKRRRVGVGPFVTFVFENRATILFQIQEMARAEKIVTDEGIETELRIYNPLIPEPGHLAATMFLELTSDPELREWLPRLVGIETEVEIRLAGGSVVRCDVDADHAAQLTRDEMTASVHYVHVRFDHDQIAAFEEHPAVLAVTHPAYRHETILPPETMTELRGDLRDGG